jgi:hypothetical protein
VLEENEKLQKHLRSAENEASCAKVRSSKEKEDDDNVLRKMREL